MGKPVQQSHFTEPLWKLLGHNTVDSSASTYLNVLTCWFVILWLISRCCSRGSSQQSTAGHPAPCPVWARVSRIICRTNSIELLKTILFIISHSLRYDSVIWCCLVHFSLSLSRSSFCGHWSEANSNLLERIHLGDNLNARADMMDTQRLMLAWPLVHATLGMPIAFPLALWRKPVVTGEQQEDGEEWWDAFRPRC